MPAQHLAPCTRPSRLDGVLTGILRLFFCLCLPSSWTSSASTDAPPSRRGSLPLLCVVGLVWLLYAYPEVGEWLVWVAGEALTYTVSLPALYGAAYFALQYLTTLCLRPNTTRIHWSTVALGHGLGASIFLLAAGPLLGRWLEGAEWRYTLPQLHGELSTPLGELGQWQWPTVTWEARLRGLTLAPTLTLAPALTLALVLAPNRNEAQSEGEQRVVRGAWWLPGAALAAVALLLNALHQLWHLLLTGCGAGPALWRQTSDLEPEEEDELRRMVAKGCDSLASKYDFGMGLTAAWKVRQAATPCDPSCNPVCPRLLHPLYASPPRGRCTARRARRRGRAISSSTRRRTRPPK